MPSLAQGVSLSVQLLSTQYKGRSQMVNICMQGTVSILGTNLNIHPIARILSIACQVNCMSTLQHEPTENNMLVEMGRQMLLLPSIEV